MVSVTAQALDVVHGRSAAGVRTRLERPVGDGWQVMSHAVTDCAGKIHSWVDGELEPGAYRLVFDSDSYFASLGICAAYPEITVLFRVQDEADTCSIQVLLAPYSYSTCFGIRI
jgi:5-hydroxyisourate hydrolase